MGAVKRVALHDVARAAGVAASTASRVLNGRDAAAGGLSGVRVPHHTRERILEAARALNYRPNLAARSLRSGRTGIVAFVLPELDIHSAAALAVDGHRAAAARGFVAQVLPRGDSVAELERTLRLLQEQLPDAAVVLAPYHHPAIEEALSALAHTLPLLVFCKWPLRLPGAVVGYEPTTASAAVAMRHLIELGRRHIVYVGEERIAGVPGPGSIADVYREALQHAGLAPRPVIRGGLGASGRDDGLQAVARLLDADRSAWPDAFFAGTSNIAVGLAYGLLERGVRLPDDVALVTLGGADELAWIHPGITSVVSDSRRPGELLGRFFEQLERRHATGQERHETADPFWSGDPLELPARLVIRGSTVRPDQPSHRLLPPEHA
jgi:DNA-binding LacI/PurR family transcriptional regulator